MSEILFSKDEILQLIPQRHPMVMLDAFYEGTETNARTGLTVEATNIFCTDGKLTEPGIIEHIAQSASAMAGYTAYRKGEPAPVGFIGEVRKLQIHRLPNIGEVLQTTINILSEVSGVSLLTAETKVNEELIADGQMKIFINS